MPWQGGVLSFDGVIERLREVLPPTFEDLEREFAVSHLGGRVGLRQGSHTCLVLALLPPALQVGVVNSKGEYMVIDSGPLPEAVAASAAIPVLFQSVNIPGESMEFC